MGLHCCPWCYQPDYLEGSRMEPDVLMSHMSLQVKRELPYHCWKNQSPTVPKPPTASFVAALSLSLLLCLCWILNAYVCCSEYAVCALSTVLVLLSCTDSHACRGWDCFTGSHNVWWWRPCSLHTWYFVITRAYSEIWAHKYSKTLSNASFTKIVWEELSPSFSL